MEVRSDFGSDEGEKERVEEGAAGWRVSGREMAKIKFNLILNT